MQGGGGQLSGALAMIIGGAIVVGAAVYFKTGINWGSLAGLERGAISNMLCSSTQGYRRVSAQIVGKMTCAPWYPSRCAFVSVLKPGFTSTCFWGLKSSKIAPILSTPSRCRFGAGLCSYCGMPFRAVCAALA